MPNEIDLVVGQVAFDKITDLINRLKDVDEEFGKLATKFSNLGKGSPQSTAELEKLTAENQKLNKALNDLKASYTTIDTELAKNTKLITDNTKATLEETIAKREKNSQTTLEIKAGKELAQTYSQLDAQHKLAVKSAQDLAVQHNRQGKDYEAAKLRANELGKQLKVIDTDIGKHTRNVGNYSSSWNGLGNSINQLTREAPAFANSVQTGFMALSNNIPILTDELGVLIQKNKDLQKDGKPTESILKTVAGAFFSWQTAISLGVTILTVYGAKIWEMITAGDKAAESQKKLNDELSNVKNTVTTQMTQLSSLVDIVNSSTESEKNRQLAYDEIKKTLPGLTSATYNQAIATGELKNATDLYVLSLIQQQLVETQVKSISDEQTKLNEKKSLSYKEYIGKVESWLQSLQPERVQKNLKKSLTTQRELEEGNQQAIIDNRRKGLVKLQEDFLATQKALKTFVTPPKEEETGTDKSSDDAAKTEEENAKNAFDRKISDLEKQKEIDSSSLDSFSGILQERQILSGKLAADEVAIVEAKYQEELRLAEGNADLIATAENNKFIAINNIRDENIKRVQGYYKEEEDIQAESLKTQLEEQKRQNNLLKELEDIVDKEEKDSLKKKADYLKSFADEFASNSGLTETFKMMSGQIEGFGEDTAVTFNAVAEASQEMFNKIAEYSMANYEQEYARLESQKETSLKFAGDSAVAKEKIEEDYAKKKQEIDKRKFEDEKKISMVNIVIDTAQAIMTTLGETGFFGTPLALIMGAFGAAQLAMVAAQQFPAYAEGTDNHSGGLMLVNDGAGANFQEKVILPSGKVIRPQGRNVLMDAPKGTKVLNHEQQLFEMLQSNNISMASPQYQGMTPDEMDEILGKHFGNIKTQNTIFDKNGFQSYVKNGNSITRSNSNRSQAIGISV